MTSHTEEFCSFLTANPNKHDGTNRGILRAIQDTSAVAEEAIREMLSSLIISMAGGVTITGQAIIPNLIQACLALQQCRRTLDEAGLIKSDMVRLDEEDAYLNSLASTIVTGPYSFSAGVGIELDRLKEALLQPSETPLEIYERVLIDIEDARIEMMRSPIENSDENSLLSAISEVIDMLKPRLRDYHRSHPADKIKSISNEETTQLHNPDIGRKDDQ